MNRHERRTLGGAGPVALTPEQQRQGRQMYTEILERIYQKSAEAGLQAYGVQPPYSADDAMNIAKMAAKLCLAAVKELELAV